MNSSRLWLSTRAVYSPGSFADSLTSALTRLHHKTIFVLLLNHCLYVNEKMIKEGPAQRGAALIGSGQVLVFLKLVCVHGNILCR